MVMIVLEYLELKVISLGDVNSTIKSKETIVSVRPSEVTRVSEVFLS